MPAAIPPASGRAGLMTAMVASIIIAVAMIVVAIYTGQKLTEAERALNDQREKDRPVLADQDYSDPRVQALNQARQDVPAFNGLQSAMQVSLAESDQLSKLVAPGATPEKAVTAGQDAMKAAAEKVQKAAKITLPTDSLTGALGALSDQVVQLASQAQEAKAATAAAQKQNEQLLASQKQQLDDKDKLIAAANQKVEQAQTELKQAQEQTTNAQAALQASANSSMKQLQEVNATLTSQNQAKDKQHLADIKTISGLKTKLKTARVNPNEAIILHPDGNIIRVGDNQTCFINLGSRQHVTKGLTFEVYDKDRGIPSLGDGLSTEAGMPAGKASIEVFNVGPDTSECRVIKTQQGQQLVIGDLISNLIYDPTASYNFVVYGNFDLSNSGVASPGDADIIKRLITQWGGKLQDKPDVNTDFVIMGVEPVVPAVTDPNNANEVLKANEKKKELEKYQSIVAAASQLSIPIMNQNRFLYFIGYYDLANR